nr:hypothetical protein [Tanacetum cinerariifolium]
MLKDVDPMHENITVQGRCISLWYSHRLNEAHNPYNLDMVLQDSHNSRIQVYIKKDGRLPLFPHKYRQLSLGLDNYGEHPKQSDNMWDEYALKRDELGHVVFILQLGKVKYWDGTPSIHKALFGLKNYLNMMKASSRYLCSPLKNRWSQSLNSSMEQSKRWCQASVNANKL